MKELGVINRQLRLLRILASRRLGVTVDELKDELQVSQKTIRRDLDRLSWAGFPLEITTESHGRRRWSLSDDSITGSGLGFDEAFALMLAAGSLGSLQDTTIGQACASALAKLRSGLSERVLQYCDRLSRAVALSHCRDVDYSNKAEIIEQLLLGHEDRQMVFIAYQSRRSTEPTSFGIAPYVIRQYQNALYVIGYSDMHDEVRTFKVDRISDAEVTNVLFTIPADFDADQYLSSALGIYGGGEALSVRIRFAPSAARAISESRWHASQNLEAEPDGSVIASYQLAITPEVVGWLLSFGPDAIVLEPDELADEVSKQATQIAANYEQRHERKV